MKQREASALLEERFAACQVFFFFFTLVTGPRRSLSLKLSDTRVNFTLALTLALNLTLTITLSLSLSLSLTRLREASALLEERFAACQVIPEPSTLNHTPYA